MSKRILVLASSSPYRKRLLEQLRLPHRQISPEVDETRWDNEAPRDLALRLGRSKAEAVASQLDGEDNWLVLGADQVCHLEDRVFGKPGDYETALANLNRFSDRWVTFSTSLVALSSSGTCLECIEDFEVRFRSLSTYEINAYLVADEPYDCAGAIKVESLGISLLTDSRGRDINSLYGLPLMALCDMLEELGITPNDFK